MSPDFSPFPTLAWTGFFWTARASIPGWTQDRPVELRIGVRSKGGAVAEEDAGRPSAEQAAAYRFLLGDGTGVREALLTAIRDRVPEWAEWPLGRVGDGVRLDRVVVHQAAWDGAAYVGYWVSGAVPDSWLTEHGAGVTAHRYRVVAVGMGEEALDESAAARDFRGLKRSNRGMPPRRS